MAKPKDELTDHSYDGIKEYDNPMPMWWKWLFVITIIWGLGYFYYYHISDLGDSQAEEYAEEFAKIESFQQNQSLDMESFVVLTDAESLQKGEELFIKHCASCHGGTGGTGPGAGGIGPNLADDYWIHGGSMDDIVEVIMNGVPEKGMISWKNILRPNEVVQVSSYIHSIRGTTPAGAIPPQGDIYEGEG